jgi:steroid delta-isomerase-like uncharacterized protein
MSTLRMAATEEERNKEAAKRYLEEGSKSWSAMESSLADDCIMHFAGVPFEIRGKQGFKQLWDQFHGAFPDMEVKVNQLVAEGNRVAASFSATATYKGNFGGVPATGRKVTTSGSDFIRIENGKVAEDFSILDQLGILQLLGAVPCCKKLGDS